MKLPMMGQRLSAARWTMRVRVVGLVRRTGTFVPVMAMVAALGVGLVWIREDFSLQATRARIQAATLEASKPPPAEPIAVKASATSRFGERLLPEDAVPAVIQDILKWSEDEHLIVSRADYVFQPDIAGSFARFRITMPVRGEAGAVQRMIQKSLRAHEALTLRRVHFSRVRIDAKDVEAQLEWVVLIRPALPLKPAKARVSP